MNLNKALGRVATTFVAGAMLTALAMPAYAAPNTAVSGQNIFKVKLDMTNAEGAGKPNVNFTYTIDDDASPVAATATSPEIKAGVFPEGTTEPVIATADWENASYTADSNPETEGNQKPYYEANVKMNFPDGTFTEPGIYRFTVDPVETDTSYKGVDVDETNRYIDVYVAYPLDGEGQVNQNAPVVITAVQLVNTESTATNTEIGGENKVEYSSKASAYENSFTTYYVTITKNVAGQMGDKGKEFNFDIDVTDPNTSAVLSTVTLENATGATSTFTAEGTEFVAPVGAKLKHGESVVIKGVPAGTTVKIDETNADGYVVTYSDGVVNGSATINANTEITVTNTREAVSPTGIVMNVAPYVLLVVVAAAGCFVFLRKRRED